MSAKNGEASFVYHMVKHGLCYNSTGSLVKLSGDLFHNLNGMKNMHLGRTKAEMITRNVLGQKTVQDVLDICMIPTESETLSFSVANDATNKVNISSVLVLFLCV